RINKPINTLKFPARSRISDHFNTPPLPHSHTPTLQHSITSTHHDCLVLLVSTSLSERRMENSMGRADIPRQIAPDANTTPGLAKKSPVVYIPKISVTENGSEQASTFKAKSRSNVLSVSCCLFSRLLTAAMWAKGQKLQAL